MPQETKFTLALLLILGTCFGVIVWQRVEHQKKLLAAVKENAGHSHHHDRAPGPSPFDQRPPQNPDAPPPRSEEPRRLPGEGGGRAHAGNSANPFDKPTGDKPENNPFDQTAQKPDAPRPINPPTQQPPRGLFSEPTVAEKPTAKPAGFNPFDESPASPRPTEKPAPKPAGFNPFDESPALPPKTAHTPPAGQQTIDAFPATHTKVQEPAGPSKNPNPFDGGFPPASPGKPVQTVSQTQDSPPPGQGGFPQPNQPEAPKPADSANPFDAAGATNLFPKPSGQVTQAAEQKPPGGFNPFTPVQHTEEKPAPPQGGFNPFDSVPIPQTPPSQGNSAEPPAPKPSEPGRSPFDSSPLPDAPPKRPEKPPERQPEKQPERRPPAPEPDASRPDAPRPPRVDKPDAPPPERGFPSQGNFEPPRMDHQQPARVYTVQTDETYWAISKKLYGTIRYFQALAEHNRHRVGDPKNLRPGMKILVPEAEILDKLYAKVIPGADAPKGPTEDRPEGLFFTNSGMPMYRVGQEDTLSDIALKHLGRTTRWVEIYNLNRETLKTPDRLRVGTVLKMPSDASRIAFDNDPRIIR